MKELLSVSIFVLCFVHFSLAQELSKEEKKRLKDELKMYGKDLAGYQAKMQDIHATLDSNEVEIKRLKDEQTYALTRQAEMENKIAGLDTELKKVQQENALLRGESVENADPNLVAKVQTAMNNKVQKGTVYKVQIGLYKQFSINKYFEQPRYLGYEDVDGMNRYIISYFPDEEIANNFVTDVRKMGIRDAFVSKYIDGVRVYEWSKNPKYAGKPVPETLEDALETSGKK